MIKRALISVSDKTGIVDFAKSLSAMSVEILSTGGTAKALKDAGVNVIEVSDYTGFPEMMNGRLKTLHPRIHGGLLARRSNPNDMMDITKHSIGLIDMVVVNLYPFEAVTSKKDVEFAHAIENIDIGGPTILRAASKNFEDVAAVVDPNDYPLIIDEMQKNKAALSRQTRLLLAKKVFQHTARYDALIADYLALVTEKEPSFSNFYTMTFKKVADVRYGENPQQKAAVYAEKTHGLSLPSAKILQGKEMSFNNYLDTHSALMLALEFDKKACAIIKHNNPCGVAIGETAKDAYEKAVQTDPLSAFGGVVAFNTEIDESAAASMIELFLEVIISPSITPEALKVFASKKNLRVLQIDISNPKAMSWDMKRIAGGLLLQQWDYSPEDIKKLKAPTKRQPTADELQALDFAWKVCKHVKSNAIVYAFKDRTAGIGVGQTSRVFSARIGATNTGQSVKGTVAASDGFFPFRDGIDTLAEFGVTAVVQPGGSVKDDEVIAAADEYSMAMLITGYRHFRH